MKVQKNMLKFILFFLAVSLNINLFALRLPGHQEDPYKPFAEVMPEPVGGLESIYKNIAYPDLAKKSGVQGKVYVLVYINEAGRVDDVKVIKGIGAGCDEAAIDAIKKASFTPGKMNGAAIKTKL